MTDIHDFEIIKEEGSDLRRASGQTSVSFFGSNNVQDQFQEKEDYDKRIKLAEIEADNARYSRSGYDEIPGFKDEEDDLPMDCQDGFAPVVGSYASEVKAKLPEIPKIVIVNQPPLSELDQTFEDAYKRIEAMIPELDKEKVIAMGRSATVLHFVKEGDLLEKKFLGDPEGLTPDEKKSLDTYRDFTKAYNKYMEEKTPKEPKPAVMRTSSGITGGEVSETIDVDSTSLRRTLLKAQAAGAAVGSAIGLNRGNSSLQSVEEFFFNYYVPFMEKQISLLTEEERIHNENNMRTLEAETERMTQVIEEINQVSAEINNIKDESKKEALKFRKLYYLKLLFYISIGIAGIFLAGTFMGVRPSHISALFSSLNLGSSTDFFRTTANSASAAAPAAMKTFLQLLVSVLLNPNKWGFDK